MESIESLPFYNEMAQGAAPPKGWQMTIRWYTHLTKDDLAVNIGGQLFHLRRTRRKEEYFNVIGELREAEGQIDGLDKIVGDDGTATGDANPLPPDEEWQKLPINAEIVVHKDPKTFHVRYSDEWEIMPKGKRDNLEERNATLHGVPSPVVSFCLGADALLAMHKFSTVLRAVAREICRLRLERRPLTSCGRSCQQQALIPA